MNELIDPQDSEDPFSVSFFEENTPDYSELEAIELEQEPIETSFTDNLAKYLDESQLATIASDLFEGIQQDVNSRTKWANGYKTGMQYLGIEQNFEENSKNINAKVYDSTLLDAILRFVATVTFELYPPKGVASYAVETPDGTTDEALEKYGELQKNNLNFYLKYGDKGYYKDSESMLMPLVLNGCVFKKIYIKPTTGKPTSRFIRPQDLIINDSCLNLLESSRITQVLYLTKKEVIIRENTGAFLPSSKELSSMEESNQNEESPINQTIRKIDGLDDDESEDKFIFKHFESHVALDYEFLADLEPSKPNFPLPYIVTLCNQTRKVVAIYRNWKEGDKNYERDNFFVQFNYFSGFGLYGYGMLHILGNNAIALTLIERQLLTAAGMANFPAFFKQKGLRTEHNTVELQPGQSIDVETGGLPIEQCIHPLPFRGADPVLRDLKNELTQKTERTASIADTKLAETSANAPVGTTVALLETQQKVQSSIIRSLYNSLCEELQMIYALLNPAPKNPEDIRLYENVKIIPACDPSFSTNMQRIVKGEALFRLAQNAPQLHNMREVFHRIYLSIGIENIEKVLPMDVNPIPLDPITENMNSLNGKPLKAEIWQDHPSHMICHQVFAEQNPDAAPVLMAHIKEHLALQYLIDMQLAMGMQMPKDAQDLQNPEIQNDIAIKAAQVAAQQKSIQENNKPPEITEVAMKEVEQKREAAHLKHEEAKMRSETESFKSQLKFETEKEKFKTQKEIAEGKNATELAVNHIRNNSNQEES